ADDLVNRGVEGEHISNAIFDELARRGGGTTTRPRIEGGVDHTDPTSIRSRMTDCLVARASAHLPGAGRVTMPDHARDFATLGILDLGIELARAHGERVAHRMPPAAAYNFLMQRQLSTSDFPILLMDAANKVLAQAYELAAPTYKKWCQR